MPLQTCAGGRGHRRKVTEEEGGAQHFSRVPVEVPMFVFQLFHMLEIM